MAGCDDEASAKAAGRAEVDSLCRRLLSDVLLLYRRHAAAPGPEAARVVATVDRWLRQPGASWAFAFERVCEDAGVRPSDMRRLFALFEARRRAPEDRQSLSA